MSNARRRQCGADACRKAYNAERMRQFNAIYREQHGEPYTRRYADQRRENNREFKRRSGFTPAAQRACRERKARKKNATIEKFDAPDVFARDGWTCGICLTPVDPTLNYPDPMSASLDHIQPLSLGGEHSEANTRPAHLRCNVRRGARVA